MRIKILNKLLCYGIIIIVSLFMHFGVSYATDPININPIEWEVHPYAMNLDKKAPTPNPMEWESLPREYQEVISDSFTFHHTMTAKKENSIQQGEDSNQYYFDCSNNDFDSGWVNSNTYDVKIGRTNKGLTWCVKARDKYGNETGLSTPPVNPY